MLYALVNVLPDSVFAFITTVIHLLNPLSDRVVFVPWKNAWVASKGGMTYHIPSPKALWAMTSPTEYQRILKVRRGEVVIDVGANLGGFTVPVANSIGEEGIVVAVEPEPVNSAFLRKSIAANSLSNVRVVQRAAFDRTGPVDLFLSDDFNVGAHSLFSHGMNRTISVRGDTLDNIFQSLRLTKVDFLKMDVEGAEVEALHGARQVLAVTKHVVVAAYHVRDGRRTSSYVKGLLKNCGFKVIVDSHHYVHARRD
jgi:FkbM family methyltransferase